MSSSFKSKSSFQKEQEVGQIENDVQVLGGKKDIGMEDQMDEGLKMGWNSSNSSWIVCVFYSALVARKKMIMHKIFRIKWILS